MNAAAELSADFEALAKIGRLPAGGWSRPAFGEADCAAHDWFLDRCRSAGLSTRYDAFGNAIARLGGDGGAAIALGSHLDTVSGGGAFDGALGVLAGLEVARRLRGQLAVPVEVIAFRDEEGRFGPLLGSRAMTGTLPPETLERSRSADGLPLTDAMRKAGFEPARLPEAARSPAEISAYLELHIEQGRVLEDSAVPLGIVTAIVGQQRLSIRFSGQSDHAGTTPMAMRRDAFAAAARFADRFRDLLLAQDSATLRGTIGIVNVTPNQGNVVPGEVKLGLEIRDTDDMAVDRVGASTERLASQVARELGCDARVRVVHRDSSVGMQPDLRAILESSAGSLGVPSLALPSGANHDAGVMARFTRAALLFVPSRGGRSHCPEEHSDWTDIVRAVDVLEAAVRRIAAAQS